MTTIATTPAWAQRDLNQSGIRRLKIVDAQAAILTPGGVIPQADSLFYEFIFPADLSCVASFGQRATESGSVFWSQSISFNLPHLADELVAWADLNKSTLWIAISEDYNGLTRAFGGSLEGLRLAFGATTGAGPRDTNPMSLSLTGDQLIPYHLLPDYSDLALFGGGAGFSYGFSTGFYS